jgi:tetratricopeptide (TPR) repeat protein
MRIHTPGLLAPLTLAALLLFASPLFAGERSDFPPAAKQRFDQGRTFQQQGKLREAVDAYDDAIRLGMADFPRVHLQRAAALAALKDFDAAVEQYSKFIERFSLEESCRY